MHPSQRFTGLREVSRGFSRLQQQADALVNQQGGLGVGTDGIWHRRMMPERLLAKLLERQDPGGDTPPAGDLGPAYSWRELVYVMPTDGDSIMMLTDVPLEGTFFNYPAFAADGSSVSPPAVVELFRGPGEFYLFLCGCAGV